MFKSVFKTVSQAGLDELEHRAEAGRALFDDTCQLLTRLFIEIDTDKSGTISYEELVTQLETNSDLQNIIGSMGLGEQEISGLFFLFNRSRTLWQAHIEDRKCLNYN